MRTLHRLLAHALPGPVRKGLRNFHRHFVFTRALRKFLADPAAATDSPGSVLADLVYGWGNESWSGQREYLQACVHGALTSPGPILECGSGLTTVLVGAVAQSVGTAVWSLEHTPAWGDRVRRCLERYGIRSVHLSVAPLKDYGAFDWYDPPLDRMPEGFGLVVCDGPPASTRGGRYGLSAVMKGRLAPGCVILLDDAARAPEQAIAEQWAAELPGRYESCGAAKPYFLMKVGG